jgi:hypothetical protein
MKRHPLIHLRPYHRNRPRPKLLLRLLAGLLLFAALAFLIYQIPPIHERLEWHLAELQSRIRHAIAPPEEAVFTPNPSLAAMVESTFNALTSTPNVTVTATMTPSPSATPILTATPTPTATPIPESVMLDGIRHEYQKWNNCGPTNLAMALSYWGWEGDQRDTAAYLKPNPRDKNVMAYELVNYVTEETALTALVRYGGDIELLKKFIAAGFPVIIEKGLDSPKSGWIGHYQVLAGYDEEKKTFFAYDSYEGDFSNGQTLPEPFEKIESYWRHFNYIYIVIYPPDRQAEVFDILGPNQDEDFNLRHTAEKASLDIFSLTGRDQFFAWYNRGTSLMLLTDYAGAAAAYDEAFKLYASLESASRPWRIFWYQTGPYFAYYYTGRYYDVLNLATQTIDNAGEPAIEESFYWRALAKEALGDVAGAIEDLRTSLKYHPEFEPSIFQLDRLGASY